MNAISLAAEIGLLAYWLGYGINNRGTVVRFPVGARGFSLHEGSQTGSGNLPAVNLIKYRIILSGKKYSIVKPPATTLILHRR
jgi:hypothetical protein